MRRLAQDKVKPRARAIDKEGTYPTDIFEAFRDAGLLGLCIPAEYGGSGAGILGLALAIEEVAKYSNTAALMLLLTRLPTGPVMIAGTEEQKQRYLPGHLRRHPAGRLRALRAPGRQRRHGHADPGRARPGSEGGWVLNGTKCWMSGVREADWYTVFAKTSDPTSRAHDSITAFIVERAWDGVEVGRTDHKMGVRGVDTGELLLTDVHVPAENVIGEVGGFRLAMLGLNAMRPIVAARGIGLAEGALMYATEYVQQRAAFGKTIADFQGIQWEIAKCAVDIEAARLLTYRAAVLADAGQVHQGVRAVPVHGQVPRHRAGRAGLVAGRPAARRGRLHGGPPDRAVVPRRQAAHHRGGHLAGAARPHRPGRARPGPVVGLTWPEVLARLSRREPLSAAEAEETLEIVLAGEATPAQVGAFLALLHAKGETAEEVTGSGPGHGRRRRALPAGGRGRRRRRSTWSAPVATGWPAST